MLASMGLVEDVAALGTLVEPQRRQIYEHLFEQRADLTLTQIADQLELGRTLVAFHLTKLVEGGLVEVLPAPASEGRRGRPSQRYRASAREVSASVPQRHYELVAEVLLTAAADQRDGETVSEAATRVGRHRGASVAAEHRSGRSPRTARARWSAVHQLLDRLGYSPRFRDHELLLRNCPFDRLRDTNCELVCGINHALAEGYLDGLGVSAELSAQLRPCADNCCVVVTAQV
jgi:predicted ArsR family transcriptional regulator